MSTETTNVGTPRKRARRICRDCGNPNCLSSLGSRYGKLLCNAFMKKFPQKAKELKAGLLAVEQKKAAKAQIVFSNKTEKS